MRDIETRKMAFLRAIPWRKIVMSDNQPSKKRIVLGTERPVTGNQTGDGTAVKLAPFPGARAYRWVPLAANGFEPPDVAVVITQEVLQAVNARVAESLEREIGGFLL